MHRQRHDHKGKVWLELLAVFGVVLIPLLVGLTRFPKILGDEGIYVSQAWWLVHYGKLGPYTYWYDHFPLGWLQIGLWQLLTGGPFALGMSVFSGRLFVVILSALTGVGVYRLILLVTHRRWLSWLGVVLFAFSPMGVIFHRQVLLDNIATFWLIWSLYFLLDAPKKLKHVILASGFLVLGILSKETLVVVVPIFLLAIWWFNAGEKHLRYMIAISLQILLFGVGLFALLALLKGELFPVEGKVSLLGTIGFQLSRGSGQLFYEAGSEFRVKLATWLFMDPVLIISGILAMVIGILWFWRDLKSRTILLMGMTLLLFLMRGGLVLDFYIIPLTPFLVIALALLFDGVMGRVKSVKWQKLFTLFLIGALLKFYWSIGDYVYKFDAVANQLDALAYVRAQLGSGEKAVADNFFFLDMVAPMGMEKSLWPIHWYTKVALDQEVRDDVFLSSPEEVAMMVVNSTMQQEIAGGFLPFLAEAQREMKIVRDFPVAKDIVGRRLLSELPYTVEDVTVYSETDVDINLDAVVESLTPEQRIGQHVIIGLESDSLTARESELLSQGLVGGVLIREQNVVNSVQLAELIGEIIRIYPLTVEPVISIAHEGGRMSPIPWIDTLAPVYWKSESEAAERGRIRARQLHQAGIDLLFAPVVDGAQDASILASDERAVPDQKVLPAFIRSVNEAGVMSVVKYYPGFMSHLQEYPRGNQVPVISVDDEQLDQDLLIYRSLVDAFGDSLGILASHAYYDQDEGELITGSYYFIQEKLRGEMGFTGLIVVDDITRLSEIMQERSRLLQKSLDAGADVVIMEQAAGLEEVLAALVNNGYESPSSREILLRWLGYRSQWMDD